MVSKCKHVSFLVLCLSVSLTSGCGSDPADPTDSPPVASPTTTNPTNPVTPGAPERPVSPSPTPSPTPVSPPAPQSKLSYLIPPPILVPGDQPINVETKLIKESEQLSALNPLIVPVWFPEELSMQAVVYDPVIQVGAKYFASGVIKKSDAVVGSIPEVDFSRLEAKSGELSLQFVLKSLRTNLKNEEHSSFEAVVSIFNKDAVSRKSILDIRFELHTPPSKLNTTFYLPFMQYEQMYRINIPQEYKTITLPSGDKFYLIAVMELKNEDDRKIIVNVTKSFSHRLSLVRTSKVVSTTECSYTSNDVVTKSLLPSAMRTLPLGPQMTALLDLPATTTRYPLALEKDATLPLGIYSNIQNALTPPAGDMQTLAVPNRCVAQCYDGGEGDWADLGKWGGSCVDCGRSSGNTGTSCFQCMREHREWCRWQHWRNWTDYVSVPTGFMDSPYKGPCDISFPVHAPSLVAIVDIRSSIFS